MSALRVMLRPLRPGFLRCLRAVLVLTLGWALTAQAGLTVATYNLENYTLTNRMVDGVYREKYPKPEAERAALRQVIAALAPDVLAVQEMGPPPFLAEFQRELKLAGQDFPHAVLLEAADADRHVAVLSKLPFKAVHRHADVRRAKRGGEIEAYLAPDELQRRLACFPDVECVEVPGAGHMVHFDEPEGLNLAIDAFLRRRIESGS